MCKINLFMFLVLAAILDLTHQQMWMFEDESEWPENCRGGVHQSPIDIVSRDAVVDSRGVHLQGPLNLSGYGAVNVSGWNDGYTLQWSLSDAQAQAPLLSGGPLRGSYAFLQLHLHWLSEHSIDGLKYPLEIHFVHIKTGLTMDEAMMREDGLAVIGVLCEVRMERSSGFALDEVELLIPELFAPTAPSENDTSTMIDLERMLSPEPQSYYSYSGSLTTPYCDEAVTWIVMDHPASISESQYNLLRQVQIGGLVSNFRSMQSVSDRVVYRSASAAPPRALAPHLPALLPLVVFAFSLTLSRS